MLFCEFRYMPPPRTQVAARMRILDKLCFNWSRSSIWIYTSMPSAHDGPSRSFVCKASFCPTYGAAMLLGHYSHTALLQFSSKALVTESRPRPAESDDYKADRGISIYLV